jgi:hypothetical protein
LLGLAAVRTLFMFHREKDPEWRATARDGEEFRYTVDRGKHNAVNSVTVGIEFPGNARFALRPEGELDPLARKLGITREFQTQDERFDKRIYVDCENPALNDALAANPVLRNAIYGLLPTGTARSLRAAKGWLWLSSSGEGVDKEKSDEVIAIETLRSYQPALGEVRNELRSIAARVGEVDPTRRARDVFMSAIVAVLASGGIGIVLYSWDTRLQLVREGILFTAALVTLGVVGALLVTTLTWLRGTPRSHKLVMDVLLAALPAASVAALGGAMQFNQTGESSDARRLTIPIARAYEEKQQKRTDYFIVVRGWPDKRVDPKIEVRYGEYALARDRNCIDVLWHDGRLGDPWIERFMATPDPSCGNQVE